MPSIITGYEYDIFISYRQKDNRSDQWVTNFIQALKEELDATFKEDISVYFDENPYDGLLESHDVDQSLNEKIKCLVFIPIVSQTYCDPTCFAWQQEFIAFRNFVKDDEFGLDIKLTDGNVAKRILPVRIHEIEKDDQHLFEKEINGIMRPMDFIYSEPGVNRPLAPGDRKEENLNRTRYKDQINKTANAIKDIIYGLQKRPIPVTTVIAESDQKKSQEKSIAVLPFANLSNDSEQEYFCDGLAEDLLNLLSQVKGLKVAARTSSFSFKNKNINVTEIGNQLKVGTVLEGSVRKSGDRLRITAQLINCDDGFHLWSEKYDREMTDIFAIQDEIGMAILKELEVKLLGNEMIQMLKRNTENAEAYQYYLKGRFNFHHFTPEGYLTAIECYDKALKIVPEYAKAHAGRASCYLNLWHFCILRPSKSQPQMLKATDRAMGWDNQIAESRLAEARLKMWHDFDFEEAEQEFLKVFSYNPNIPDALSHYGFLMSFFGRKKEAFSICRKITELDPFSPMISVDHSWILWMCQDYDGLFEQAKKMSELHSNFWGGDWCLAFYYMSIGNYDEAISHLKKVAKIMYSPYILPIIGGLYGVIGQKVKANKILSNLKEMEKKIYVGSFPYAIVHAGLGEMDLAFNYFEKAGSERTGQLIFLYYYARDLIPTLNQDSRFIPYLEKLGIHMR